jgi:outer membrane protein assembly factor BamD
MCDCRPIALPRKAVMGYGCVPTREMTPKGQNRIMFFQRTGRSKASARSVFLALSVTAAPLLLSACMSSEKDIDLSTYVDQTEPADVLYNQALANMNAGRLEEASKKLDAVDTQHP